MFSLVEHYWYLLPTVYLYVADIANPDLFACNCQTWNTLDISRFYEKQCQPFSGSAWPAFPQKTVNRVSNAGGWCYRHCVVWSLISFLSLCLVRLTPLLSLLISFSNLSLISLIHLPFLYSPSLSSIAPRFPLSPISILSLSHLFRFFLLSPLSSLAPILHTSLIPLHSHLFFFSCALSLISLARSSLTSPFTSLLSQISKSSLAVLYWIALIRVIILKWLTSYFNTRTHCFI